MGDDHGELSLQHDSVYGAAVAARMMEFSAFFPKTSAWQHEICCTSEFLLSRSCHRLHAAVSGQER